MIEIKKVKVKRSVIRNEGNYSSNRQGDKIGKPFLLLEARQRG